MSIIKLAGISGFTGPSMTLLTRASLLTPGSLVSVEPAGWTGVPATNAAVPNLAATQCNTLVGAGADVLTFVNEFTAAEGVVEKSAKGGLHVIKKQTSGQTLGRFVRVSMSTPLRTYLAANVTHDIYLSWWGKRTRAGLTGSTLRYLAKISGTATAQLWAGVGVDPITGNGSGGPGIADPYRLGFTDDKSAEIHFLAVGSAHASTDFGGTTHANVFLDGLLASTDLAVSPSFLTWALYVEDLTVSGRTFAAVEALDHALHTAMCRTYGGIYYGDTYTDPATV